MAELEFVTEVNFNSRVIESSIPVLVDFTAVWCGPCKMVDPLVKQLSDEWGNQVDVVKCDADKNPNIIMQFGIMGIPTLILFKGGSPIERVTGYQSKEKLNARFSPHFGK